MSDTPSRQGADDALQAAQASGSRIRAKARQKGEEFASGVADAADAHRGDAADTLERGADFLDEQSDRLAGGQQRIRRAARAAAGTVQSGADYLRDTDVQEILEDAADLLRRRPGVTLVVAALAGFLIARALRSD
jgi:acyl-CoA reductase-like NAD-dependent aldehyde dehydrogenase